MNIERKRKKAAHKEIENNKSTQATGTDALCVWASSYKAAISAHFSSPPPQN